MGRGEHAMEPVQDELPYDGGIHQLDCGQHTAMPTTKALKMNQVSEPKFGMGKMVGDSIAGAWQ